MNDNRHMFFNHAPVYTRIQQHRCENEEKIGITSCYPCASALGRTMMESGKCGEQMREQMSVHERVRQGDRERIAGE